MAVLGLTEPWKHIAERSGMPEHALRQQIQAAIKRRNDIVHRGDRALGQQDDEAQPIDYAWAYSHVTTVGSVVQACDALAEESVRELRATAGVS